MTKSKLAVTCLLAASILSPICVNALTQQEAADIVASSQEQATLSAEQKRMALVQLVKETSEIQEQISQKISEMNTDKTIRTVSITLTAIGTTVVGLALFTKKYSPYGFWTETYGFQDIERILFSLFTTGVTAYPAMIAIGTNNRINLDQDKITLLKSRLAGLQTEFNKKIAALN